jgi:tungstate transport system substrate-binding protein
MKHWIIALFLMINAGFATAQDVIKVAVTTSFHNSGLADVLLPQIAQDLDLEVRLLVVGTGQALRLGRAGDVDAVLVHSRKAEDAFVSKGYATHRREIMYNDFVVIGPSSDPAKVKMTTSVTDAQLAIYAAKPPYVSRGDDSGTHAKERALWALANLNSEDFGPWYKEVGAGMGKALNTAAGLNAYILSDRASWLNFGNKAGLEVLFSGDPLLFNQYAFLPVNPTLHPHVKAGLVEKLEAWLTSDRAAALINGYQINGETLFTFNATP